MSKPSVFDRLEAYDTLRMMAQEVAAGLKLTKAGDSCRYVGSMQAVEDFKDALCRVDELEIAAETDEFDEAAELLDQLDDDRELS